MNGKSMLYIDQYGAHFYSRTVEALARSLNCQHVEKMYQDKTDGTRVHVGYIIRGHWLRAFVPYEKKG